MDAPSATILDEAVADTAAILIEEAKHNEQLAHDLRRAMISMSTDLRNCRMADYAHPEVTIAYLVNYHVSRVGLAFYLLQQAARLRTGDSLTLTSDRPLHIIDFGCGTLAVQFGLAITLAHATANGKANAPVRITSMDRARSMLRAGDQLWNNLLDKAKSNSKFEPLLKSMESLGHITASFGLPSPQPGEETWLTTLHTVHNENRTHQARITAQLTAIAHSNNPELGIISFHWSPGSTQAARDVWPFPTNDEPSHIAFDTPLWSFSGRIPSRAKREAIDRGMYHGVRGAYPYIYAGLGSDCSYFISESPR